jgi:hypothetical protein
VSAVVTTVREPDAPGGELVHAVSPKGTRRDGFVRRTRTVCGRDLDYSGFARTSPERTAELHLIGPILDLRAGSAADVTCPGCRHAR